MKEMTKREARRHSGSWARKEIFHRTRFNFKIIKYPGGKSGYNVKVRELLSYCGINRKINQYDEKTRYNAYLPL